MLLVGLYAFQAYNIFKANKPLMTGKKRYEAGDRYRFSPVANLELAHVACFRSELAVVSMLPSLFERGYGLAAGVAGAVAGTYAFMNIPARPGGGWLSDKVGSRKGTMVFTLLGTGIETAYAYLFSLIYFALSNLRRMLCRSHLKIHLWLMRLMHPTQRMALRPPLCMI